MKKTLANLALLAAVTRFLLLPGVGGSLGEKIKDAIADGRLVTATINFQFGAPDKKGEPQPLTNIEEDDDATLPDSLVKTVIVTAVPKETGEPEIPPPMETPEVVATTIGGGLKIKNNTNFEVSAADILSKPLTLTLPASGPQILIIHTHGSEAYTQDRTDVYVETDSYRTQDERCNVLRVGDELAQRLTAAGLEVLHDREIYDYPSYTGSYARSGAAVERYLAENPSIAMVIDVHRDALGSGDVIYKTMAETGGQSSAQVMFVMGTGENGLSHPKWRENLALALTLQQAMDDKYPTLARPVNVAAERYNQQLTTGSLLLEVGSSGNTLQEALTAIRLFADAAAPALLDLVEKG